MFCKPPPPQKWKAVHFLKYIFFETFSYWIIIADGVYRAALAKVSWSPKVVGQKMYTLIYGLDSEAVWNWDFWQQVRFILKDKNGLFNIKASERQKKINAKNEPVKDKS